MMRWMAACRRLRQRIRGAWRAAAWLLALTTIGVAAGAQEQALETCADGEPTTSAGLPDGDADGVPDAVDNCIARANSNQRDTDGDGFGNLCDADLDNNGIVNPVDLGILKSVFFEAEPNLDADLDGDGVVAPGDLAIMREDFFRAPGPHGPCLADPATCAGPADFEFDDIGQFGSGNLFVFRSADPATIYHARRLIAGVSECNPNVSAMTVLGTQSWNPDWGFHMRDTIMFHGSSIEPLDSCDQTAAFIEANLASWCSFDESTECAFWCPWHSKLTRELKAQSP